MCVLFKIKARISLHPSQEATTIQYYTKGNSGFCRSSTEIRMFVQISVEVLQKSVKVFEKNCVQQV